jgi:outer membrane protein OmpA-like peptidoglycan-associated protein
LKGRFLLASTLTSLGEIPGNKQARFRINLSLTDLQTGYVLAQSAAQTTDVGVDMTPTKFYQDSPSITRDRVVDGHVRTAQAKAGSEADGIYVSSLSVSALIAEGSQFYDAGQFEQSLHSYETAAARPDGKQLRVFNGLYLNNMQLGRSEAAESAFARIVSLGLATNSLAVKFLFKPGSTEFLEESKISAPYPMWLNVLAKEMGNAQQCVSVIGHSSHTGTENVNDRLSLARAAAMQRRLESILPSLSSRLQPLGMGYRENLIGTGTDDLRDSLDRRVEFRVRNCL